jgi:hypothetical protein
MSSPPNHAHSHSLAFRHALVRFRFHERRTIFPFFLLRCWKTISSTVHAGSILVLHISQFKKYRNAHPADTETHALPYANPERAAADGCKGGERD